MKAKNAIIVLAIICLITMPMASAVSLEDFFRSIFKGKTGKATEVVTESPTTVSPEVPPESGGGGGGVITSGVVPVCSAIGTRSEGWYLKEKLIKYDNCAARAVCKGIGTRSEGWYSSFTGKLIMYANCGGKEVKEQVKCLFMNTTTEQECYSDKGSCKAPGPTCTCPIKNPNCKCIIKPRTTTCIVDVKGKVGEKVEWKSSCGGYAYTTMDGRNENARFNCGGVITKCTDSDGGKNYYVKGSVSKCSGSGETQTCTIPVIDSCEKCTGECETPPCEVKCGALVEYYCENSEIQKEIYPCDCKDGACIQIKNETNTTKCAENGKKVYISEEFGPTYCCSKNAGIKPSAFLSGDVCIAPNDGSKGTCIDGWWKTCGDGVCHKKTEDKCSCLADCSSNNTTTSNTTIS